MAQGYTRNDTSNNIETGNIINATDLDGEFDALQSAFDATTGHTHDGTVGGGAPISTVGPTQEVVVTTTAIRPSADNTLDLGTSLLEFKDLYIDGTANIDSLVADTADINGGTIDNATIATSNITVGSGKTLDVSAGTLTLADNQISGDKVEGGTIAATTITTLTSTTVNASTVDTTNLEVTTLKAKDGTTAGTVANTTGVVTLNSLVAPTADINGGTLDGTTIGASVPAASTFTTTTATTGNITTVNATTVDTTNIEVTTLKAKDGTAAGSIADTTGVVTLASSVLTTTDINGGTIDGATIGGSSAAAGTFTTVTGTSFVTSGDMTFGDNDKAIFGAGSDLQIYHDGGNSFISDVGTGDFIIRAGNLRMQNSTGTAQYILADDGGAVQLRYNGATKIATTATGVDVTGTVTATAFAGPLTGEVTGNASTATTLQTARTIGGVSFDGSANINLPGVNTAGTQDTSGNAATATALQTARTISLSGDVTGSVSFNGTADVSITATVADDSHNHTISNVDGLQDVLNAKADLSGATFTGNVGIGSAPTYNLDISSSDTTEVSARIRNTNTAGTDPDVNLYLDSGNINGEANVEFQKGGTSYGRLTALQSDMRLVSDTGEVQFTSLSGGVGMRLATSGNVGIGVTTPTEKLDVSGNTKTSGDFITTAGNVYVGKTASSISTVGFDAGSNGAVQATRSGGNPLALNRTSNDGSLIVFFQAGTNEGNISVAGTTVSYNGGHLSRWAQFPDNSRPELLKGTVMSNLDQMSSWDGEDNEQLNCVQVSTVEGDPDVAGVFVAWDSEDDGYNDILLAMTGDMVIRIGAGITVVRGDLLMSAGDGTAKPQGDDIVRSKTIAKVTSTHVSHNYEDGSYAVPCVLMAC